MACETAKLKQRLSQAALHGKEVILRGIGKFMTGDSLRYPSCVFLQDGMSSSHELYQPTKARF